MDATLLELCFTHASSLFPPKPLTSPDPTLSLAFILPHLPPTLPVFPLMSPAVSTLVCCRTLPSFPFPLFPPRLFLPTFPPPRPPAPHRREKASSLSSLFAWELILTPGYSPADER